jgi:hypothetical protein
LTPIRPLIGARYPLPYVEAKEYYMKKKRITDGGTHDDEMERRMSEECLLAFKKCVPSSSLEVCIYPVFYVFGCSIKS